ncbi:MAG: PQQ-binding-like beta-propeller repeat protein [Pirellulales bacterium]
MNKSPQPLAVVRGVRRSVTANGSLWASLLIVAMGCVALEAADWPAWRGSDFHGVAAGGPYPTHWSATEGVVWSLALPGKGTSTPVVSGDKIFLTVPDEGRNELWCLDRDGKKLWQVNLGTEVPGKNKKASGCNPSPVTDGKYVYAYFKSGDLACVDMTGKVVWQQNLQQKYGEDTLWWDLGTSPVLTDQAVVIAVMQTGGSYVVGLDRQTGSELWKQDRNLDAPEEAAQSYTTPLVLGQGDAQRLVIAGADHVTGHDARTGKELWRVGGLNPRGERFFRSIASPVANDELVVAPYARGNTLTAVRLGGEGDVTKSNVAWHREGKFTDVPTPALRGDRLYLLNDQGRVECLNVKTGETIWELPMERNRNAYSASPVVAGDQIYVTREDGRTFIVSDRGDKGELVASNDLGESVIATPVLLDGRIYLRTMDKLYCLGK